MGGLSEQGPFVERRQHPRGEAGTRTSLSEVAKRAAEGRIDPKTRAWAMEKVLQAGYPKDNFERASVILSALRKERAYFPDPTDAEFVPSSACQLEGCQGLKFLGEDCDGLLVAFLAGIGSIGIFGAVVGHSYDKTGQLSHVLAGVQGNNGTWRKGDPTTSQPFGTTSASTREIWIAVHDGRVLCDKTPSCSDKDIEAPMAKMRPFGDFVGVGSPATGAVSAPPGEGTVTERKQPVLREIDTKDALVFQRQLGDRAAKLRQSRYDMRLQHEQLVGWRTYLDKPIEDQIVATAYGEKVWSKDDEEYYQIFDTMVSKAIEYGEQAAAGRRPIAWDEANNELVVLGNPDEPKVDINEKADLAPVNFPGQAKTFVPASYGAVGFSWQAAALVAVIGLLVYFLADDVCHTLRTNIQANMQKDMAEFFNKRREQGDTPEQATLATQTVAQAIATQAKANADKDEKASSFKDVTSLLTTGLYVFGAMALLGMGVWAITTYAPRPRPRFAMLPA